MTDGSSLEISYEPNFDKIKFVVFVANYSYVGMGFGDDMINTDMVAWIANWKYSRQLNLYSSDEVVPTLVRPNIYTTDNFTYHDDAKFIKFITTRPLDMQDNHTYVIPLEEPFDICYAYNNHPKLLYHQGNRGAKSITLLKDGSC